jgi:L-fuculose-phosphate aldolase
LVFFSAFSYGVRALPGVGFPKPLQLFMKRSLTHPRDEIMSTMERIYRYRMTTTSGGNLSIREPDGGIWISPARVDKGSLTRNDIVRVSPDGTVDGPHPPSSEFPFHKAIYAVRPDIRAIVHAHPVALVAFSICRQVPNTRVFHQAHSVCGRTGFAPYALPGSSQLGEKIAAAFSEGLDSVILENHGVVVGGESLSHAFQRFEAFEFAAKTLIKAAQIGTVRFLDDEMLALTTNRPIETGTLEAGDACQREQELRRELQLFLRRGCRQRLFISTEGSFSARVGDDSLLITPTGRDRELLGIEDFVLVQGARAESGKCPSRVLAAHRAIYSKHPHVQAIVMSHPVNATAFSVTDAIFDSRTIPESYVFLREVGRVPHGLQYGTDEHIADFVSKASPAALLENDGVLVTGTSILDVFDRLEVLESTAEAVINATAIGDVSKMSESVIQELREAFKIP